MTSTPAGTHPFDDLALLLLRINARLAAERKALAGAAAETRRLAQLVLAGGAGEADYRLLAAALELLAALAAC